MNNINKRVSEIGVVPVIKLTNPERDAAPLAKALCAGGLPIVCQCSEISSICHPEQATRAEGSVLQNQKGFGFFDSATLRSE